MGTLIVICEALPKAPSLEYARYFSTTNGAVRIQKAACSSGHTCARPEDPLARTQSAIVGQRVGPTPRDPQNGTMRNVRWQVEGPVRCAVTPEKDGNVNGGSSSRLLPLECTASALHNVCGCGHAFCPNCPCPSNTPSIAVVLKPRRRSCTTNESWFVFTCPPGSQPGCVSAAYLPFTPPSTCGQNEERQGKLKRQKAERNWHKPYIFSTRTSKELSQ